MRNEKKKTNKDKLKASNSYKCAKAVATIMDRYCIDGLIGLVPGGIGDAVSAVLSLSHIYFSLFKLKSIPLTLAVLNNMLRDVLIGMIPFYIGDALDFFHKSNSRNMRLIEGFVENDKTIISDINRKAAASIFILILLIAAIALAIALLAWISRAVGSIIFS